MPARQTVVNTQPGLGVAGDFADSNPRFTADFGAGGAVAGPNGLTIGLFAWAAPPMDADGASASLNNFGAGPVTGFVAREQQGLITQYLQDAGMLIPGGFMATVFTGGGFLVTNAGSAPAIPGQKAYANLNTGQVTFAATGTPTAGGTSTASTVAAETFAVTGSIANDILSVSAVASGEVQPGSAISGTGVISGTTVTEQLSGTPGGIGTYLLSSAQPAITSETINGTWGLLTIGGTVAGTFPLGGVLSGATGPILANASNGVGLTGAGGAGTYAVPTQTVSSGAIDVTAINVETKWYARSYGAPGALVKISDHPYG
jgi:hypothetical protein